MRTYLSTAVLSFVVALCALPTVASAQWRYPPIYPYPAYRYATPDASIRVKMTPANAAVYVNGYFAGTVDQFDGALQRLRVEPGEHAITIYREGFHSRTERLYLSPNSTRTIAGALEALPAGSPNDPLPSPSDVGRDDDGMDRDDAVAVPPRRRGPVSRRAPSDPPAPRRAPRTESRGSQYASLTIRVQPAGAVVRIDGERWDGPASGDDRLVVQVPEGHHVIEVERDGYERFATEVDVYAGETTPININLRRR